jgi:1-acyl-sn-glycerol-3-phosphate acyltransferase
MPEIHKNISLNEFIPADESKLAMSFFAWYSRFKLNRVFKDVYLDSHYKPDQTRSTLYFGNHSMWWDALTPLVLNEFFFKQRPRAVMELEQVKKFSFFKKIGCFSINRSDPRSALKSLQYGIDWLNISGNSLYIYPQGKLENPSNTALNFETGIGWMIPKLLDHVDLVPLIQHSHFMYDASPSLYISVGKPITKESIPSKKNEIAQYLEGITKEKIRQLIDNASHKDCSFPKMFG